MNSGAATGNNSESERQATTANTIFSSGVIARNFSGGIWMPRMCFGTINLTRNG